MALQRRLLRFAVEKLGAAVDFPATEALRTLALAGRAGQKLQLAQGLRAERTARELQLRLAAEADEQSVDLAAEYTVAIPGDVIASAYGFRLKIEVDEPGHSIEVRSATLRNWKPGDRVRLRHSSGPRKVKEVLERLKVTGSSRTLWPVLELNGRIVWMQGVEVEPASGIRIHSSNL
jgi:tRNA(Ile)-lysidine synthase